MNTIYYKFPDSGTASQIFLDAGFYISGEEGLFLATSTHDYAIDVIGPISGAEDFYHVNLRVISESFIPPPAAEQFRIEAPLTPERNFL
jgi:hypothetical protein